VVRESRDIKDIRDTNDSDNRVSLVLAVPVVLAPAFPE